VSSVIYARVSTETQEKHQTIDSQLAELRRYAEVHELAVMREFIDDGYSGSLLERPALDALRDAVGAGGVDAVLCLCPDRLARNLVHQGLLLEEFGKRGVRVIFANQQIEDTPEGKMFLQIQGAVAECERAKIVDRCRRGMLHKAREGHVIGGRAPYGYRYVHRNGVEAARWEIDEEEARVVREIYRLFVEERRSIDGVMAELRGRGIQTRSGGERWSKSLIYKIVSSETYCGTAHMFKSYATEPETLRKGREYRRSRNSAHRKRAREEWIAVPVPAIVTRGMWEAARGRLAENQQFAARCTKPNRYLLRGLLKCGSCGLTWRGQRSKDTLYYVCRGRRPEDTGREEACAAKGVRADRIEALVWNTIRVALEAPELLLREYWNEHAKGAGRAQDVEKQRAKLERLLRELDREEMRVVRLYREEKIKAGVLEAQLEEVGGKRSAAEGELEALRQQQGGLGEDQKESLARFCEDIRLGLEEATFEEKQQVLRLLVERIEMAPDAKHATLYGVLPVGEESTALRPQRQADEKAGFCKFSTGFRSYPQK